MNDRARTLLAILGAATNASDGVSRTTLMKQVFLFETVRPLYRHWMRTFRFVRYRYGPYDSRVFQILDGLIFNGMVEVVASKRAGARLLASYRLTEAGMFELEKSRHQETRQFAADLVWALESVGATNAQSICRLVYQEAEFAQIFSKHEAEGILPFARVPLPAITSANNSTFLHLSIIQQLRDQNRDTPVGNLTPRDLLRVFLRFLSLNAASQRTEAL